MQRLSRFRRNVRGQGKQQVSGKLQSIAVASRRLLVGMALSLVLASAPFVPAWAQVALTNTVTVTPSPAGTDGTPGNNSASADVDVILVVEPLVVSKTLEQVNGVAYSPGEPVMPGDVLTYGIRLDNGGVTDTSLAAGDVGETLPGHTTVVSSGDNDFTCSGGACVNTAAISVPAGGSVELGFVVEVVDPLPAGVANIHNAVTVAGVDCGAAGNDCIEDTAIGPVVTVAKSSDVGDGTVVSVGDTIQYTVTVSVANAATRAPVAITDTLGSGLAFGTVVSDGGFACTTTASGLACTLPAGAATGDHELVYTATVGPDASVEVENSVTTDTGTCTSCSTRNPLLAATMVAKGASPASGSVVLPGSTIEYTLTVTVTGSSTREDIVLVDTLGAGLAFGAVTGAGGFACNGGLACTLPAGAATGSHSLAYTAIVDPSATGTVANSVVASTAPGGDPDPVCTTCTTEHVIEPVAITVAKSAAPPAGTDVRVGDTIAYTVAVNVANSATTAALSLVDTLGPGLDFGAVTEPGAFTCSGTLECVLPAGTRPGLYEVEYTATVGADASMRVRNEVSATGGGGVPDCSACAVEHPLAEPRIVISKSSDPGSGTEVRIGDTIRYVLTATVENSATQVDVHLVDSPGAGLDIGGLPAGCSDAGGGFRCLLPAGTPPGTTTFTYTATVNANAGSEVRNAVLGESAGTLPECVGCETTHTVIDQTALRITKSVGARTARVGDLLRYTLVIENVGARHLASGTVLDTPPAGFSHVAGSMAVADGDGAFALAPGMSPLRIEGLDIPAGDRATVTYLMRVGAGVRAGVHVNEAVAVGPGDAPLSNVATARVLVEADALLEDSLVLGTVFHDRNGDGWQDADEAGIPGVRIASVEGLLVETDRYGRYHLAGVHGGDAGRGRNFILKVDAATLPPGARFTTANPLVRRITQGVPVRFGFGVQFPEHGIPGPARTIELQLGEVFFAAGSSTVPASSTPAIEAMAAQVETHGGGEVVITAEAGSESLALARAGAVRDALVAKTGEAAARGLRVALRTRVDDPHSMVAALDGSGALLGTVLFDTDRATIRPEFTPMLDRLATRLDAMGGGNVVIVGHADIRASRAYNAALGMRRARAVFEALATRLSPAARARLRVESSDDPDAPLGLERE